MILAGGLKNQASCMQIIKINLSQPAPAAIAKTAQALRQGKIIAYPTDTIYGLGCRADKEAAVLRLYRMKKRSIKKPMIILVKSLAMASQYAFINQKQKKFLAEIWPGPVTVVLSGRHNLPSVLLGPEGQVAIRLPKNKFIAKVIKKAGYPLVSTSLNISGRRPLSLPADLEKHFGPERPDLVIEAGSLKAKPSKIIDLRDINHIKKIRD